MTLPLIAIIGRPNVGKSRLFNRLIGKYTALVDDHPGVTRDRHYGLCDWRDGSFLVVDTGGLIPGTEEPLNQKVWKQAFQAVQEADALIVVFDAQSGLTPVDEALVQALRKMGGVGGGQGGKTPSSGRRQTAATALKNLLLEGATQAPISEQREREGEAPAALLLEGATQAPKNKPIFFAINKVDSGAQEQEIADFTRLGIAPLFGVSAEHGRGIGDMLDGIYEGLKKRGCFVADIPRNDQEAAPRIAIIGRPNVGKSTLINQLAGEDRVVVHEEAGTTRDAIDVRLERGGHTFVLVDTAGIRKKSATRTRLDKFSVLQSLKAIDHAQLVCLVLDAMQGVTHQDLQLAHTAWEARKGLLFLVNKWDLMKTTPKKYCGDLRPQLRELQDVPVLCISSKTGQNCQKIWTEVLHIHNALQQRLPTAKLNCWLEEVSLAHPLPLYRGKTVKLYYATQVGTYPPHVVLFTNTPQGIPDSYRRYLTHQLQEALNMQGIPIRLSFRLRKQ